MRTTATAVAVLAAAGIANAQVWDEVGDAGQDGIAAAQETVGVGSLTAINGTLGTDVDLYAIMITDVDAFTASTVDSAGFDTQLFLFAADGTGITENDDDSISGSLQSVLNSDGLIATGSGPGLYYVAVTEFNQDPLDADGIDMFGFDTWPGSGDQRSPVSALALDTWDGASFGSGGDYTIALTGAGFAIPSPASLALLGMGGLLASRRRR
ncbi:MAG: DVUA0089 family protein [Planctomycetota bacterium]